MRCCDEIVVARQRVCRMTTHARCCFASGRARPRTVLARLRSPEKLAPPNKPRSTGFSPSTPTKYSAKPWKPKSGSGRTTRLRFAMRIPCPAWPNTSAVWIRHGGWFPDRKDTPLPTRTKARWTGEYVHESVRRREGTTRTRLKAHIQHFTCDSLSEHVRTLDRYTTLAARELVECKAAAPLLRVCFSC